MKILVFTAPWCAPCKTMHAWLPMLHTTDGHAVEEINVDEQGEYAASLGIHSLPTMILLDNGAEAGRIVGATNIGKVRKMITEAGQ